MTYLVKVNYAVVRLHIKNTKAKIKQKHKKVQKQTETTLDKQTVNKTSFPQTHNIAH